MEDELIKIAENGQWSLEKAKQNTPEQEQMIRDFQARREQAAARPTTSMPTNMKPVATHNSGNNPQMSKERVAALRAGFDRNQPPPGFKAPQPNKPEATHADKVNTKLSREQAEADQKAHTTQARKDAWEASVALLARTGNRGYEAIKAAMDQRKKLDAAHATGKMAKEPKAELLPPGRPGTFHNQGMTTTGKIVNSPTSFEDKETGERRFARRTQQEQHHWAWDHNKQKWNHLRTTLGPPAGGGQAAPVVETAPVKRSAPKSAATEAAEWAARPIIDKVTDS